MISSLVSLGSTLIDRLIPDQAQRAEAKLKLLELEQKGELAQLSATVELAKGQMEVNKVEAAAGTFRGGWRPAVGWICAAGMGYQFLLAPLLAWASGFAGWPEPPTLNMSELMPLLFGMLGLGGLRTYEKCNGKP